MPDAPIVFLDVEPEDEPRVRKRYPQAQIHPVPQIEEELLACCRDAAVISTFITTSFPRRIIERLPSLRLLCTRSVGTDHIDAAACAEKGIVVCNVPDYGSHVIAEHAFALLLSTLRHITEGDKRVEGGIFRYQGLKGMALMGKTIGIVGTGNIGRAAVRIAHGFGMRILAYDVCRTLELERDFGVQYVELNDLLSASDIISLHVPAMPATYHMLDAAAFARMKKGVIVVNTARGSLIDADALLAALAEGIVAYALLDVLEHEADVHEDRRLVRHPNVVLTPHIAFYTDTSVDKMYEECFQSINQWLAGEQPTHTVEPPTVVCAVR